MKVSYSDSESSSPVRSIVSECWDEDEDDEEVAGEDGDRGFA